MASRISQMRNGQMQALNPEAIERIRALMQQVKMAQDPQAALAQILQNNSATPVIHQALQGGHNLEQIARNMAQQKGIDINKLINQLGGV